jgi:hypothetical protein
VVQAEREKGSGNGEALRSSVHGAMRMPKPAHTRCSRATSAGLEGEAGSLALINGVHCLREEAPSRGACGRADW